MPIEIELKFRVDDPDEIRRRLTALGAAHTHSELETNTLFDTPARDLLRADSGLRTRACNPLGDLPSHSATLTFKGPPQPGAAKRRDEIEFLISDAPAAAALLARLGYQPAVIYEKRRETWRVADCLVTLDQLPRLGNWLEIEGPTESAVLSVRNKLDLTTAPPVHESYVAIAARHGTRSEGGAIELRFT